ncbi:UNVERIFIED_CONTAM: Trimeric GatFAB AmidoTransferase(AdT) complex subunit [Siphonaria sp. JEL0065]|nr:Trimeric GatFAB AmidoTransferase(AdT) complex subunit [Siphonaria sp. JEL0065]
MQKRFLTTTATTTTRPPANPYNALIPPFIRQANSVTDPQPPLPLTQPLNPQPLKDWSIAIKANIATTGSKELDPLTSCSSNVLSRYTSPYKSTVAQLLETVGGANVIPWKANCDEFGMGSYNIHSPAHGVVRNPLDVERVSGGSSGGSAVAVSSGDVRVALGTDTGGSIRLPASYCGIVGFKPSYGRFSRWGVVAYASSLDTVGVLGRNVGDVESVYGVLNVRDEKDPTSLPFVGGYDGLMDKKGEEGRQVVIGVPSHIPGMLSRDTLERYSRALQTLEGKGCKIMRVELPYHEYALGAYYCIASAESSSNLARFDGLRYGSNSLKEEGGGGHAGLEDVRDLFGDTVKRRIMLGTFVLGSRYVLSLK